MTSAMTSRVMSSWVGPNPPHTTTASDRSSASSSDMPDAIPVVADLRLEVGVDAGQRELLTDPRRVGVDYLPEQKLGAYGHDLTAHGRTLAAENQSPCIVVAAWRPSRRYWNPLKSAMNTEAHNSALAIQ